MYDDKVLHNQKAETPALTLIYIHLYLSVLPPGLDPDGGRITSVGFDPSSVYLNMCEYNFISARHLKKSKTERKMLSEGRWACLK